MKTNRENYTTYQPYILLDYNFSFSDSVELTDISITVLEIIRRMNLNKMIDLKNYDTRAYDTVMMLTLIVVAFSEHGYASLRELEKLCNYDMRYRMIAQGQTPSYKAFQRCIKNKLTVDIEVITKEVYVCVQDETALANKSYPLMEQSLKQTQLK